MEDLNQILQQCRDKAQEMADLGVEAEGDITYDSGSEIDDVAQVAQIETGKPAESQTQTME